MTLVRLRVALRGRAERVEVAGPELTLGSEVGADVLLRHASVAPRHARLLVRRGRLILVDLGTAKGGTLRASERLRGPVALAPGEAFRLGEVALAGACVAVSDRGYVGRSVFGFWVCAEIDAAAGGVRRYELSGTDAELSIAEPDQDGDAWRERVQPYIEARGGRWLELEGRAALLEPMPPGARFSVLLADLLRRRIRVPVEAAVVAIAQLAAALDQFHRTAGPHGALEPRRVHVGVDGTLRLLAPGPSHFAGDDSAIAYWSPQRRYGAPPSTASDAYALGVIAQAVLRAVGAPAELDEAILPLLAEAPRERAQPAQVGERVRESAERRGLDPSSAHLASVARVLVADVPRPLVVGAPPEDGRDGPLFGGIGAPTE